MASGEEARRHSLTTTSSSSSVGLEALFPAVGASEQACADGSPELVRLRERLRGGLSQHEPLLLWAQRLLVWERPLWSVCAALTLHAVFWLLVWERPLWSVCAALTLHAVFWLLSSTSLRPLFLLSVSLLGLMLLERWKHKIPLAAVQHAEVSPEQRESLSMQPRLLSIAELSHHLADAYLTCCLHLQDALLYRRQQPGKFCLLVCCGCMALFVVGHYVPGIMISYIIVLSVLLWPLVVYHELIQRMYTGLEPIFMKLDYSMKGETVHRKHDKRKVKKESEDGDEPRAETESDSEEELSCFAPTVDVRTTALAMAITDSELSDEEASILESGGFSVSRATTPQLTDVSEDLDQQSVHSDPEEAFLRDLPEFPSDFPPAEHGLLHLRALSSCPASPSRERGDPRPPPPPAGPASLLVEQLASPLHFVNTHFNGHRGQPGGEGDEAGPAAAAQRSLEALSEEIVSTAISAVVQNTLAALLGPGEEPQDEEEPQEEEEEQEVEQEEALADPAIWGAVAADTETTTTTTTTPAAGEEEDFELLDQSELELRQEEVSEGGERDAPEAAPDTHPPPQQQPSS